MNIAINGFGRIGRQCYRIIAEKHPNLNVVLINDLTDNATLAHLLEFDSTYGRFNADVTYNDDSLTTKYGTTQLTAIKDPTQLPHRELNIDIVLECTGVFRTREKAALHLEAGAKRVIMSAPAQDEVDGTFCIGVNEADFNPDTMQVVSNASCTTNCLAPMAKVLHEALGIEHGFMTTIHSYTNDQRLLDLPHSDLRRARAAAVNMIPTTTGAAKAVGLVLPELAGKLDGLSVRVPTQTGSITDLTVQVSKATTAEEVNALFKAAAESAGLAGILGYEDRPLVQNDYVQDSRSCIIDGPCTKVHTENGTTMVKVFGWYDNEWGYSNRLVELAELIGNRSGY